jgi:hypothetical protein
MEKYISAIVDVMGVVKEEQNLQILRDKKLKDD